MSRASLGELKCSPIVPVTVIPAAVMVPAVTAPISVVGDVDAIARGWAVIAAIVIAAIRMASAPVAAIGTRSRPTDTDADADAGICGHCCRKREAARESRTRIEFDDCLHGFNPLSFDGGPFIAEL